MRKLKCDGFRPTCEHCEKRNQDCCYDRIVRRRGPGQKTKEKDKAKAKGVNGSKKKAVNPRASKARKAVQQSSDEGHAESSSTKTIGQGQQLQQQRNQQSPYSDSPAENMSVESEGVEDSPFADRQQDLLQHYGPDAMSPSGLLPQQQSPRLDLSYAVKAEDDYDAQNLLSANSGYSSFGSYDRTGAPDANVFGFHSTAVQSSPYPLRPIGNWTSGATYSLTPSSLAGAMSDPLARDGRGRGATTQEWRVDAPLRNGNTVADPHHEELYGLAYGPEDVNVTAASYLESAHRQSALTDAEVLRHEYAASNPSRYAAEVGRMGMDERLSLGEYGGAVMPSLVGPSFLQPPYSDERHQSLEHSPIVQYPASAMQDSNTSNDGLHSIRGRLSEASPATDTSTSSPTGGESRSSSAHHSDGLAHVTGFGATSSPTEEASLAESLMSLAHGPGGHGGQ